MRVGGKQRLRNIPFFQGIKMEITQNDGPEFVTGSPYNRKNPINVKPGLGNQISKMIGHGHAIPAKKKGNR